MVIKTGDSVPDVALDIDFPPKKVNVLEHSKGKKVVILGLPGA
jgi:peroxiredoxin